jgi:hypothetical protein
MMQESNPFDARVKRVIHRSGASAGLSGSCAVEKAVDKLRRSQKPE